MKSLIAGVVTAALLAPSPALAWGYEGHEVVASIARTYLTPAVRAKVDAILSRDPDTLTAPDMISRATWADAYRSAGHRETAQWHFADVELDQPDLKQACFGFPAPDQPASVGPPQDCVVDKVREFSAELASPATPGPERLLALKYLLHFVGDVHQPLHASDNHDRGGNCVLVTVDGANTMNLHAYWDTAVVEALDHDPSALAMTLRARITPAQRAAWSRGDPATWAQEAFQVARSTVYRIGSAPGCARDAAPIALPPGYAAAAQTAAAVQLEKAGVRLAAVLNRVLATVPITPVAGTTHLGPPPASAPAAASRRTPASLACSAQADTQNLHGKARQRFRRRCIREARRTG